MAGVLVIAETAGEELASSTIELVSEGRRIADALGQPLYGLLAGKDLAGVSQSLGQYGVDRVLLVEKDSPLPLTPDWLLAAYKAAVEKSQAEVVLLTHASLGRRMAPELAFALDTAVVTDCTALHVEDGRLVMTKPVYGGNALAEMVVRTTPQVATLRPRAFEAVQPQEKRTADVEALQLGSVTERMQVLEEVSEEAAEGPRLKDAKIVVAGGRGVGAPENWHYVEDLAKVLGAAVGASRAVTDAGWVTPAFQVGLTGASIAPDLYVTIGISGAVQHVAGISGARNVVAINKDTDANIFKYARYGVAGDWKEVVPAMIKRLEELRS